MNLEIDVIALTLIERRAGNQGYTQLSVDERIS